MLPRSRHDHYPRADLARRAAIRAATAALADDWLAKDSAPDGLLTAMAAVRAAPPAAIFAALRPWLTDLGWLESRLDSAARLAGADPFAVPPLRAFGDMGFGGLMLAECGPMNLSLLVRSWNMTEPPASVTFRPGHVLTRIVRSGGARALHYRAALTEPERAGQFVAARTAPCNLVGETALVAGTSFATDKSGEAFLVVGGDGDVVLLQLSVAVPSPVPTRCYAANDGRLLRTAASSPQGSFQQMALSLLRMMGRRDAAPQFAAALATDDFAARWQSMRELVALDALAARPHLAAMAAGDPHPEVRAAAAATLTIVDRHLAAHAQPEPEPCPA